MRTLFAFFRKHHFFFFFLFLEGVCIILMSYHNPYHRTHIINSTNGITAFFNSIYGSVDEYFGLKESNIVLSNENALLRNELEKLKTIKDSDREVVPDYDTSFIFIPARVINNSVNRRNNFLMINKGSKQGIEEDMGVISPQGVVGVVVETSQNYSTILSLLHKDSRISARIKKNMQLAKVTWPGLNYREALLEDVPTHIRLNAGDTIITSGYSFLFPEGIIIGFVKGAVKESKNNFNEAVIRLSEDFNNLKYVYVVKNMNKAEIDSLKFGKSNE